MNSDTNKVSNVLHDVSSKWQQRSKFSKNAHYEAGNYFERVFLVLGCLVVILSAVIGSTEVLVTQEQVKALGAENVKAISGVISLFIAILAGLQTFLKFSQKAEHHKLAGAKYGEIHRALEELHITFLDSSEQAKVELHEIKQRMDQLALESPELPGRMRKKIESSLT